jgi:hypothetical protein
VIDAGSEQPDRDWALVLLLLLDTGIRLSDCQTPCMAGQRQLPSPWQFVGSACAGARRREAIRLNERSVEGRKHE